MRGMAGILRLLNLPTAQAPQAGSVLLWAEHQPSPAEAA